MRASRGFPDAGDGRYAQKLPYGDWVKFNNAVRVHLNFVESLPCVLTILLYSGLFLPKITMYVAFVTAGARIIYIVMYLIWGSNARKLGAITSGVPVALLALTCLVLAIIELVDD